MKNYLLRSIYCEDLTQVCFSKLLQVLHVGILYCYFLNNVLVCVSIVASKVEPPNLIPLSGRRSSFLLKSFDSGSCPLPKKLYPKLKSQDRILIYRQTVNHSDKMTNPSQRLPMNVTVYRYKKNSVHICCTCTHILQHIHFVLKSIC